MQSGHARQWFSPASGKSGMLGCACLIVMMVLSSCGRQKFDPAIWANGDRSRVCEDLISNSQLWRNRSTNDLFRALGMPDAMLQQSRDSTLQGFKFVYHVDYTRETTADLITIRYLGVVLDEAGTVADLVLVHRNL